MVAFISMTLGVATNREENVQKSAPKRALNRQTGINHYLNARTPFLNIFNSD